MAQSTHGTQVGAAAPPQKAAAKVPLKWVVAGVITVLALWFILANQQSARIRLWLPTITAPVWLVLLATLIAGALVGWLWGRGRGKRE